MNEKEFEIMVFTQRKEAEAYEFIRRMIETEDRDLDWVKDFISRTDENIRSEIERKYE